jgi:hypothetical protein
MKAENPTRTELDTKHIKELVEALDEKDKEIQSLNVLVVNMRRMSNERIARLKKENDEWKSLMDGGFLITKGIHERDMEQALSELREIVRAFERKANDDWTAEAEEYGQCSDWSSTNSWWEGYIRGLNKVLKAIDSRRTA